MEETYNLVNIAHYKPINPRPSTPPTSGPSRSESRFHGAVVVFLGLLSFFLLVGLISLGVHYHYSVQRSAAEFSNAEANLTERLQTSENKTSSLTEERDLLKTSLTKITEERDLMNTSFTKMTKERDLLNTRLTKITEERDLLKTCQNRSCPEGWRMFLSGCYFLSTKSGSWDEARQDCNNMDADLVVIDSPEEQTFVSNISAGSSSAWIGLTDRANEGTWTWINDAPLSLKYWGDGEPNDTGGEDCAKITTEWKNFKNWNDVPCNTYITWVCEKELM